MVKKGNLAPGEKIFYLINSTILWLALLIVLYPLIYIFSAAFSSSRTVSSGKVWLFPVEPSLEGFIAVFKYNMVWVGYLNTFIYTICGTAINLVMTILAAYPLSRIDFKRRGSILFIFTFTMIFSGGLIPHYILIYNLGLLNTRLAMLLPGAIVVWNLIITRTFFQHSIPFTLFEAASMDGCNDFRYLISVALPLSKAVIAVITLFYAIGHWNQFFLAFLYLNDEKLFPLQIVLRDILILNQNMAKMMESGTMTPEELRARSGLADLLRYSLIIIASLPVWIVYPFVQRYFVTGVMIGSIKE